MASHPTKMVRESSTAGEPVNTAGIANPTEDDIAAVAHQLWLDSGCPVGSDQEHWFRAEAELRDAVVAKCDTRTESEMVAEFTLELWEGHWEVWEHESACARWVWDARDSGVRVSNCAR